MTGTIGTKSEFKTVWENHYENENGEKIDQSATVGGSSSVRIRESGSGVFLDFINLTPRKFLLSASYNPALDKRGKQQINIIMDKADLLRILHEVGIIEEK